MLIHFAIHKLCLQGIIAHSKVGGDTMDVRVLNSTEFYFFVNQD